MNEEQAERMIQLLSKIENRLDDISDNTSSPYDNHDICIRLDEVVSKLEDLENTIRNND